MFEACRTDSDKEDARTGNTVSTTPLTLISQPTQINKMSEKKEKKDKKLFDLGPMEQILIVLGIMAFGRPHHLQLRGLYSLQLLTHLSHGVWLKGH